MSQYSGFLNGLKAACYLPQGMALNLLLSKDQKMSVIDWINSSEDSYKCSPPAFEGFLTRCYARTAAGLNRAMNKGMESSVGATLAGFTFGTLPSVVAISFAAVTAVNGVNGLLSDKKSDHANITNGAVTTTIVSPASAPR